MRDSFLITALFWPLACGFGAWSAESVLPTGPAGGARDGATNAVTLTAATSLVRQGQEEGYRLRPGDRVSYQVTEDREPSRILVIADSGEVEIPCLGRVRAAGKTCAELRAEIKESLEQDYYHAATVVLGLEQANRSLGRVYVWGQVRNQGAVEVLAAEALTAGKAILRAGGFTDFANRKRVKVVRADAGPESTVLEVNLAEVLDEGRTDRDIALGPDDVVIVSSRMIRF